MMSLSRFLLAVPVGTIRLAGEEVGRRAGHNLLLQRERQPAQKMLASQEQTIVVVDVAVAEVDTIRTRDELVDAVSIFWTLYGLEYIPLIRGFQPPTTKVSSYSILWLSILLWVIYLKGFPSHGNQRKLGLYGWRQQAGICRTQTVI
jgi:hypothetical protein